MAFNIKPCTWKHGKKWAYSVTFDEALEELFNYTVPLHEELGIPGHVEVVVGHMGKERQIGTSSYNGYHHMGAELLRKLINMGWGVGNHSWSHGVVADDVALELGQAKRVLEDAIGHRVTTYVAPGDNHNINPTVVAALQEYGYLCALGVSDDINPPDVDVWFMNRCSNLHQGFGPLWSAFDPFRRLAQAEARTGWVVDYCHCPSPQIPHENKDVYISEHRQRLEAVLSVGGDNVWLPTVEEGVDYLYCLRHLKIEQVSTDGIDKVRLSLADIPASVQYRTITFDINIPNAQRRCPYIEVNGNRQPALLVAPGIARATIDLAQPAVLSVGGLLQ